MRRLNASWLALVAISTLITSCDQRPIELGPESTGMEWRRVVEFPSGESSHDSPAVWASNPSDVWVWSRFTRPNFQHFDGNAWSAVSFQPGSYYYIDIWGSGPSNIYVVDGAVHHFDGVSWTDTGIRAWQISGSSASNVFVASDSLVLRFNGAAWDTLRHIPPGYQIRDISAYGTAGALFAARDSLLQWENDEWKAFEAPALADRVVAFGDGTCVVSAFDESYNGTFWHFSGGVWTPFDDPFNNAFIDDMWGTGFSSLWVADDGRLQRFDGNSWSVVTMPTNNDLFAVWGTSDSDVYSVGGGGVTLHNDGAAWSVLRSGVPSDAHSLLATSASDFLVGGGRGTIYHYRDGEWSEEQLPGENSAVAALAGSGSNRFAGTTAGTVYRFDGTNWALSTDSLGQWSAGISDLAATSDGAAYAVGYTFISQFDGSTWRQTYTGQNHFQQVWAASKSVAFATAYEGVFEFDGAGWKRVLESKRDPFQGIWGSAADDVYVAGGDVFHFNGHVWKNVFPGGSEELVTGTGPDDVVTLSQFGVSRFDGAIWRWNPEHRNSYPIDLVSSRDGQILRMYQEYRASDTSGRIVVSQRVTP